MVKVKIGQVRQWLHSDREINEMFLVIGLRDAQRSGYTFVDYIMDGERCSDDQDWVEKFSEVISEG